MIGALSVEEVAKLMLQLGLGGAALAVVGFVLKHLIEKLAVPMMNAHVSTMERLAAATNAQITVTQQIQTTQLGILKALEELTDRVRDHMRTDEMTDQAILQHLTEKRISARADDPDDDPPRRRGGHPRGA